MTSSLHQSSFIASSPATADAAPVTAAVAMVIAVAEAVAVPVAVAVAVAPTFPVAGAAITREWPAKIKR
jgi:hypothetical protein